MDFQKIFREKYKENPNVSGKEILESLHLKNHRSIQVFWRELNKYQVSIRGLYPDKRRNTHAHSKSKRRGDVYWIPPKNKEGNK